MLKWLLFFISFSVSARTYVIPPPNWFYDRTWQQAQIMHIQTQQQLQAQDFYNRSLLLHDQERQLQRIADEQHQLELRQQNIIMHQHSDRLRLYGQSLKRK